MRYMNRQDETFVPSAPLTAQNTPPAFRLNAVRSVRMHKQLAGNVAVGVFVLIVLYALTRRPVYEAESLTYVEPLATKVMSDGSPGFYDPSRYDSYLDQQIQTAQRPDILAAAAAKLPEGVWRNHGESIQATAARLGSVIQVKRVGTSYQLSISGSGTDPVAITAAVNAVTDAYLEQGSKDEHAMSDGRIQLLTEERTRIQNELLQANTEQNTLSTSLGVANPVGEAGNQYDSQLANLRTELAEAREAHDVAAAQLQSMSMHGNLHSAGLAAAANDSIAGDSGLSTMKATINQRRAILQGQMAGLTPSNPTYKLDQQEIAAMDRNLDTMTVQLRGKAEQNLQDKLRQELERTAAVESKLNAQLAQDTARATGAAPKLQRATELAADITRLQGDFAGVDASLRSLQLETQGPGMAHLAVAATVPSAPAASRRNQLLLLAIPLALLAGVIAAIIARKRDVHAYTGDDLQHMLGFPPMAVMPADSEVSEAVMEEYLLRFAAGVERANRADGARSFVFTALSGSQHISGLVEELARKLGELGFAVSTVDVDAVMRSEAGQETELRRGAGAATVRLEQLQQGHDLLLIEARPLLFSAEAEYAVCAADAPILIAESGVTLCKELKDAANLLERLHVNGVAVVLHELRLSLADSRFVASVEELERTAYKQRRREAKARKAAVVAGPEVSSIPVVEAAPVASPAPPVLPELIPQEPIHVAREVVSEPAIVSVEPVALATVAPAFVVEEVKERKIEETVAAPEPIRAPAPRPSSMWDAEKYDQPKPSFFDRIFKRFHEPVVSILPDRDEEENARLEHAVVESLPERVYNPPPAPIAEAVSVAADPEADVPREIVSEVVDAEEPPHGPVAAAEVVHTPERSEHETYREEILAAVAQAAAKRSTHEVAVVVREHVVLPEPRSSTDGQNVARDVAAARHARVASEVLASRRFEEPSSLAVMEPEPTSEQDFGPSMQPGPEPVLQQELEQPSPYFAERGVSMATSQPMMRQWEFRQARSMRESAANAARIADESNAFRRASRPGVVSATGRRTLLEEAAVPVSSRAERAENAIRWRQEAQVETSVPARKWGMLSRFDQRFEEQCKESGDELAAQGTVSSNGARAAEVRNV